MSAQISREARCSTLSRLGRSIRCGGSWFPPRFGRIAYGLDPYASFVMVYRRLDSLVRYYFPRAARYLLLRLLSA